MDYPSRVPEMIQDNEMPVLLAQAEEAYSLAQNLVYQTHLDTAAELAVVPFHDLGVRPLDSIDSVRLLEISRVVHDKRENSLDNLLNIFAALGQDYGLALIIASDAQNLNLYLGIRAYSQKHAASSGSKLLKQAIAGHFPGTEIRELDNEETHKVLGYSVASRKETDNQAVGLHKYGNAITGAVTVPSLKAEEREAFTQGIERFIDAMEGKKYTAIILAEPMSSEQISKTQEGFEQLSASLSGYSKTQLTLSQNESQALGKTMTKSFSNSVMDSLAKTQTQSDSVTNTHTHGVSVSSSTTDTKTKGKNFAPGPAIGAAIGAAIGFGLAVPAGIMTGTILGGAVGSTLPSYSSSNSTAESNSLSQSESKAVGLSKTESTANSSTQSTTEQKSISSADSNTKTIGTGTNLVIDFHNTGIERLSKKIDARLDRIDGVRAYGAWTAGAYFIASDADTADIAASIYIGTLRGENSDLGGSTLIKWHACEENMKDNVLNNLTELVIPRLIMPTTDSTTNIWVTPATLVSGKELALMMNLPRRSVGGINVIDGVSFGREPSLLSLSASTTNNISHDKHKAGLINLGVVRHLYKDRTSTVSLDVNDLTRHILVTGTTGSGKSTAIKEILKQLHQKTSPIPFLFIEPAKNEFTNFGKELSIKCLSAGRYGDECLRLNPLIFPLHSTITVMEHIDRVCALFNAAFPMYAAMPQILEEALIRSYEKSGWDLLSSRHLSAIPTFPTLADVANQVEFIVTNAGYSGEAKSTYIGALKTRLASLMRGSLGLTFETTLEEETPAETLFEKPCIINISSVGSLEKKAILIGLILIRLEEHRIAAGELECEELRHLIVLEEAHNLLKSSNSAGGIEVADPRSQALEYFAKAFAEMRAYGQGFLIADQSASALDSAVLRNTNTKIIFCAPFDKDREILAGALALDAIQRDSLARLEMHTALVKQNNWAEAVLCHIEKTQTEKKKYLSITENTSGKINNQQEYYRDALIVLFNRRLPITVHNTELTQELKNKVFRWISTCQINNKSKKIWTQCCMKDVSISNDDICAALNTLPMISKVVAEAEKVAISQEGILNHIKIKVRDITGFVDNLAIELIANYLKCAHVNCKNKNN